MGAVWSQTCNTPQSCAYPPYNGYYSTYWEYASVTALYDGRTFVATGGISYSYSNQVSWTTSFGVSWNFYVAPWSQRYGHGSSADLDNYVYVLNGYGPALNGIYGPANDLWYSTNVAAGAQNWNLLDMTVLSLPVSRIPYEYFCQSTGYSWSPATSTFAKQLIVSTGYTGSGYTATSWIGKTNLPVTITPPAPPATVPANVYTLGFRSLGLSAQQTRQAVYQQLTAGIFYCTPLQFIPSQALSGYVTAFSIEYLAGFSGSNSPTSMALYASTSAATSNYNGLVLVASTCGINQLLISPTGTSTLTFNLSQMVFATGFSATSSLPSAYTYTVCVETAANSLVLSYPSNVYSSAKTLASPQMLNSQGDPLFVYASTTPSSISPSTVASANLGITAALTITVTGSQAAYTPPNCPSIPIVPKILWSQISSFSLGSTAREYAASSQYPLTLTNPLNTSLFVVGGYTTIPSITYFNDVWQSVTDGSSWTEVDLPASHFSARYYHQLGYLANGNLVLVGGLSSTGLALNDVWLSTTGGATWSLQVPSPALWTTVYRAAYAVLPNTNAFMLISGQGNPGSAVFVSTDGVGRVWTRACSGPGVCPWSSPNAYVYDGALTGLYDGQTWVFIGGYQSSTGYSNQVAYSMSMGTTWSTYLAPFPGRYQHQLTSDFDNYVYMQGGQGSSVFGDLWFTPSIMTASGWTQVLLSGGSIQQAFTSSVLDQNRKAHQRCEIELPGRCCPSCLKQPRQHVGL